MLEKMFSLPWAMKGDPSSWDTVKELYDYSGSFPLRALNIKLCVSPTFDTPDDVEKADSLVDGFDVF